MLRSLLLPALLCCLAASGQTNLRYVENKGQWPDAVLFKADAPAATIWVENGSILIDRYDATAVDRLNAAHSGHYDPQAERSIHHHAVRLKFIGANTSMLIEKEGASNDRFNYFTGNDPQHWASDCRAWSQITMKDLYPGVDLVIHAQGQVLKYDLVFAPGADPSVVRIRYDGANGIDLRSDRLVVRTSLGDMIERVPAAWLEYASGARSPRDCAYQFTPDGGIGFHCDPLPWDARFVIDPTLEFSTFSGSTSDNFGYTATFDSYGFLYSGSSAFGQGYPTTIGAYDTTHNGGDGLGDGTDIAITMYDTTGSFLVWSTFIGGGGDDLPHSLICNANDEVFILGSTSSLAFPVTSTAFDQTWNGGTAFAPVGLGVNYIHGSDMILARLSADGSQLLASTYIGGSLNDGVNTSTALKYNYADEIRGEILLDEDDNVYVISTTQSTDFPTTAGAYQTSFAGGTHDGIAFKMDPTLSTLVWSTFFGGTNADAAYAGELDVDHNLFITGGTNSTDLPVTASAVQPTNAGGTADAFVARLSSDGSSLMNSTYWGSALYDQSYFVEKDNSGDIYLFGQTTAASGELVFGAPYNLPNGGQFITKLQPALDAAIWSSRFGNGTGAPNLSPTAFLVDYCRRIYIAGWGSNIGIGIPLGTTGMPVTADAYQPTTDGNDFYVGVFDIDMTALYYATFFGGALSHEHVDGGTSRFDRRGRIYESVCAGCGGHDDFPSTPGAWSPTNNSSNCNNGVFKMDFDVPLVYASAAAPDTVCGNTPIAFDNLSSGAVSYHWDFGDFSTSTAFEPVHSYVAPGLYTVTLTATDPLSCNFADSTQIEVYIDVPGPTVQAMSDTLVCGPIASVMLTANSSGTADQFIWSSTSSFSDTLNTSLQDSTALLLPAAGGTYWVMVNNASACDAIAQVTITVSLADIGITGDSLVCADEMATLALTGVDPGSTIVWEPAGEVDSGQGTSTITTTPSASTLFTVDVTSPVGCDWSGSLNVDVSTVNGSDVHASVDQPIVIAGTLVHLSATPTGGVTWSWSPAAGVSDPTIANPTAIVDQTTTFIVTVSDGICTKSASVIVRVYEYNCGTPDIFVPNAFTPNGDGDNDVLYVRGRNIRSLIFRIYDRWGEKVFETSDQSRGWDATYNDKEVDPAVFVWYLDATCGDGQSIFLKGNTTVIR